MTYYRTIRLADTDAAGVVYCAALLSICHEAYEAALQEARIDLKPFLQPQGVALPIVRGEIDFWRPIAYGDRLAIEVTGRQVEESEFEVCYRILAGPTPDLCLGQGMTRHACIDPASRRRLPLPPAIRQWLSPG